LTMLTKSPSSFHLRKEGWWNFFFPSRNRCDCHIDWEASTNSGRMSSVSTWRRRSLSWWQQRRTIGHTSRHSPSAVCRIVSALASITLRPILACLWIVHKIYWSGKSLVGFFVASIADIYHSRPKENLEGMLYPWISLLVKRCDLASTHQAWRRQLQ
jgi:hypothetical protein